MADICIAPARRPAHPGRVLNGIMREGDIAVARLARHLHISRQTLYDLMEERRSVSVDMAARLSLAFGNSARFWLNLQANHDAWGAERAAEKLNIGPFAVA